MAEDDNNPQENPNVETGSEEDAVILDELTSLQHTDDTDMGGQMQGRDNSDVEGQGQQDMNFMASIHQGGFSTDQEILDGQIPVEDENFQSDEEVGLDDEGSDNLDDDIAFSATDNDNGDGDGANADGAGGDDTPPENPDRQVFGDAVAPGLNPPDPNAITDSVDTLEVFSEIAAENGAGAPPPEAAEEDEEEILAADAPDGPNIFGDPFEFLTFPEGGFDPKDPPVIREGDLNVDGEINIRAFYDGTYFRKDDLVTDPDGKWADQGDEITVFVAGDEDTPDDAPITYTYDENGLRVWTINTDVTDQDSDIKIVLEVTKNGITVTSEKVFEFDVDNTLVDDAESTRWDSPVDIDILANDTIIDNDLDYANDEVADATEISTIAGQPVVFDDISGTYETIDVFDGAVKVGEAQLNTDGSITYTPTLRQDGDVQFDYTVTDNNGEVTTATVTVTVDANDPPVVGDITLAGGTEYATDYVVTESDLLANASDIDNDDLSVTGITGGSNLTITEITAPGDTERSWRIVSSEEGDETITFSVDDGNGGVVTKDTTINFADVDNDPDDDTANTTQGSPVVIQIADLLSNDDLPDGGTVTAVSSPSNGTVVLNNDGTITFTPDAGYDSDSGTGAATFVYTVTDEDGEETTATVTVNVADLDNTPDDDAVTTDEDVSKTFNVLTNDDILDGASVSVGQNDGPDHGTITVNTDGTITYKPDADYNGADSFVYTVTDDDGETTTATVNITVDPTNDDPIVGDITLAGGTEYATDYVVTESDLLANASDIDNDDLSVTGITGGSNLTITEITAPGDTERSWRIVSSEEGDETITFSVDDGNGGVVTKDTTINFADVDNDPDDDTANTTQGSPVVIQIADLLSNDDLPDGGTVTAVSSPSNGTVVLNNDGTITFTPDAGYDSDSGTGAATFVYTVTDEDGEETTATVTVNVADLDNTPDDDAVTTDEDVSKTFNVLTNDDILDGASVSVGQNDGPDHGTITVNTDGTITYKPDADYNGADSFVYTVTDDDGETTTATVNITVDPTNDDPIAVANTFTGTEDNVITFTTGDLIGNDSDIDQDSLFVAEVNGVSLNSFPADGIELDDGTLTYDATTSTFTFTPDVDWSGSNSLTYTVSDGEGGSAQANITLDLSGIADTPDLAVSVVESDRTGETMTMTYTVEKAGYSNLFGYYVLDENGEPSTGKIMFVNQNEMAYGESYTLEGYSKEEIGFFLLPDAARKSPHIEVDEAITFAQDSKGVWRAYDEDGALILGDRNTVLFTEPRFNQDGIDHEFDLATVEGEMNWEDVLNGGDEDYHDGSFNVVWDETNAVTTYDVNVSAAITDDDFSETLQVVIDNFPAGATFNLGEIVDGKLVISGDDLQSLDDLTMSWTGPRVDFTLEVTATAFEDGTEASRTVNVGPNFRPDGVDDVGEVLEGSSITMDLLANDFDLDGDTLSITEIDGQAISAGETITVRNGSVTLNEDGTVRFDAIMDKEGWTFFRYTVSDGEKTHEATVNLEVTDTNIHPVGVNDRASTTSGESVLVDVLANDYDLDNDALTIPIIDGRAVEVGEPLELRNGKGTVTLQQDGKILFEPADGFTGGAVFSYRISDGEDLGKAYVTVNVAPAPEPEPAPGPVGAPPPVTTDLVADNAGTLEDTSVIIDLLANDTNGENLTITQIDGEAVVAGDRVDVGTGEVTLNNDGTVTFAPDEHHAGTETFEYTVSDGAGGTYSETATVNIEAVADAPVLTLSVGDVQSYQEPATVNTGSVDGNDIANATVSGVTVSGLDSDGNPAAVEQVTNGHGSGIGVAAHTTGPKDLLGFDSQNGNSETLIFQFDEDVREVSFDVEQFGEGGNGRNVSYEQGTWKAYDDGQLVASGQFDGRGLNNADDAASVTINGITFDRLEITADETVDADGSPAAGASDFAIDNLEFTLAADTPGAEFEGFPITLSAQLVDQDTSETLSVVTLQGLPDGAIVLQDGVELTVSNNTLELANDDLTGLIIRVPVGTADFNLQASVTSTDSNNDQATTTVEAYVDVESYNAAPTVSDATYGATEDTGETYDLVANGSDGDSATLTITAIDGQSIAIGETVTVSDGAVTLNADGSINFKPATHFSGETSFDYTISDDQGASDTATATIEVEGVADAASVSVDMGGATSLTPQVAMVYPVDFAVELVDASETLVDNVMSVDLSSLPSGSVLTIGDATVSVDQLGGLNVTQGDDVSISGFTMSVPLDTLGEDLSISGSIRVPVDGNNQHEAFDITAAVQTVDGDDIGEVYKGADIAGTSDNDEIGSGSDDQLSISAGDDGLLSGGAGDDTLTDNSGDDVLLGGADNDTFHIGDGSDVVDGGAGDDMFVFNATADAGTSGTDWIDGGAGSDTIALGSEQGWTLTITNDQGASETLTGQDAVEDYQDVTGMTGQIDFNDGSTIIFEGVEKVEW